MTNNQVIGERRKPLTRPGQPEPERDGRCKLGTGASNHHLLPLARSIFHLSAAAGEIAPSSVIRRNWSNGCSLLTRCSTCGFI